MPPTSPPPTGPTGQVFNSAGAGNFNLNAWNGGSRTTASVVHTTTGAVYTGLALGNSGSSNYPYAANFAGSIDVFNSSFGSTTLSGSFKDPTLPSGYVPYNVQNIAGTLFVEYAKVDPVTHQASVGAGFGYVDDLTRIGTS